MIRPRYLLALGLAVVLCFGMFFAFTLAVDPYGVSPVALSESTVNQYRPMRRDIDRLIKPYEVWRDQPRTVFLGSSRFHQSIDPTALDGTRFAPAYNASMPASTIALSESYLRRYLELDPALRTVVVELFLYNFLGDHPPLGAQPWYEYAQNAASLFASAGTLLAAVQTLYYNQFKRVPAIEIKRGGFFYFPPGLLKRDPFDAFAAHVWSDQRQREGRMRLRDSEFESMRRIGALCRERRLELIFLLTPNHAYVDYHIDAAGEWATVREWLSRLAAEPVTIYSFSQPNDWVDEPVSAGMRYWNDPYHFSIEMGNGMQQALAGRTAAAAADLPDNFMIRMTPDEVGAHVESRRAAIRQLAADNPAFVAQFQEQKRLWQQRQAPAQR
jgi:hypothetical protein